MLYFKCQGLEDKVTYLEINYLVTFTYLNFSLTCLIKVICFKTLRSQV